MLLYNYTQLFRLSKLIILNTGQAWDFILKKNNYAPTWHIKQFIFPFIFLIFFSNLLGYLYLAVVVKSVSYIYAIVKTFAVVADSFLPFFLGSFVTYKFSKTFNIIISFPKLFTLYTYSFSVFWIGKIISGILANYPTLSSFFVFLGISGVYIFIVGCEKITNYSKKHILKLLLFSFIPIIIIYSLIRWFLNIPIQLIHYHYIFGQ